LLVNVKIKARIAYIKSEWARIHKVDKETQTVKLHRALDMAEEQRNPQAMVKAIEATNRIYGLDKQVVVQEQSEAAKELSEQERRDAEEFEQWKMRKRLKATKVG